jgi:hypothetical protein
MNMHMQVNELTKAESEVSEAIEIYSKIWKTNPAAYGDDFARSQLLAAEVLRVMKAEPARMCALLRHAAEVAYEPSLEQLATAESAGCLLP